MQACSVCHVDAAAVAKSQAVVLQHVEVHVETDVAKQPAVLQLAAATLVETAVETAAAKQPAVLQLAAATLVEVLAAERPAVLRPPAVATPAAVALVAAAKVADVDDVLASKCRNCVCLSSSCPSCVCENATVTVVTAAAKLPAVLQLVAVTVAATPAATAAAKQPAVLQLAAATTVAHLAVLLLAVLLPVAVATS